MDGLAAGRSGLERALADALAAAADGEQPRLGDLLDAVGLQHAQQRLHLTAVAGDLDDEGVGGDIDDDDGGFKWKMVVSRLGDD